MIARTSGRLALALLCLKVALSANTTQIDPSPASLAARIEQARAETKNNVRLSALGEIAQTLPLEEIPEALRLAAGLPSLRERMAVADTALRRWGELAPAAAFAHVAALPEGYSKAETIRSIAAAFARKDGGAAAAAAVSVAPGRARLEAIQAVAESWAATDVNAALGWARDLPEVALREAALRKIYFVWVHSDPASASAPVQQLPAGEMRNTLLMNIATNWASTAPGDAIRWTRTLATAEERELAQALAIESWADTDPLAACQFAEKLQPASLRQRAGPRRIRSKPFTGSRVRATAFVASEALRRFSPPAAPSVRRMRPAGSNSFRSAPFATTRSAHMLKPFKRGIPRRQLAWQF